jgi:putative ABC transport system permease protein
MLQNYVLVAWRNLLKNTFFSVINISGLAIGMAACLLILQYVYFEKSYDQFHEKADRIYRIQLTNSTHGEVNFQNAAVFPTVGPFM